eukprot:19367-Heterococcus_DN1.PRE.5
MLKASILSDRYASGRTLTVGYESLWGSGCYSTKSIAQYKDLSVCLRNVTPAIQEAFLAYLSTYDPQKFEAGKLLRAQLSSAAELISF